MQLPTEMASAPTCLVKHDNLGAANSNRLQDISGSGQCGRHSKQLLCKNQAGWTHHSCPSCV